MLVEPQRDRNSFQNLAGIALIPFAAFEPAIPQQRHPDELGDHPLGDRPSTRADLGRHAVETQPVPPPAHQLVERAGPAPPLGCPASTIDMCRLTRPRYALTRMHT